MKKIIPFLLSFIVLASFTCTASAETMVLPDEMLLENDVLYQDELVQIENPGIEPYASNTCTLGFKKISSTTARAQVIVLRSGATSVKSTIWLQRKSGNSYVNTSAAAATKSVASSRINHLCTFKISASKTYRIKVAVKYTENGIVRTNYYYRTL